MDGVSLVPLMARQSGADSARGTIKPRPLYWHYPHYDNQGGEPSSLFRDANWKLIHYYEDGRNELYDLAVDPAETSDLARTHPVRTQAMWEQLKQWLDSVGALYPKPDPRYDPARTEAKFRRLQTRFKEALEQRHAERLRPDWQPNPTWWGSESL